MQHHTPPVRPRSGLRTLSARLLEVILYPLDFGINFLLKRQLTRDQAHLSQSIDRLRYEHARALQNAQNRLRAQSSQSLHEAHEHIRRLEAQNAMALRANQILLDRVKAYVDQKLIDTNKIADLQEALVSPPHASPQPSDLINTDPLRYRIEGPFETSYSLAIINRHLAFALEEAEPGSAGLWATEGPGDYEPDPDLIALDPRLQSLWQRGVHASSSQIVIRNLYPPRVHDMQGKLNLLHFYWEETSLPAAYVADFNRFLHGILAPTHFVKKVLRDNGVFIPIAVMGVGVDHMMTQELAFYRGALGKGFRFLHVSSAFERKGLDVLIEAFARAFILDHDVILIIKTFPNPHNRVHELIAQARASYESCPPIQVIEEELSAGQILDLYARCDCFVSATRGEGFGLPMAEAMVQDLPVIVSAATGHADFCNNETAFIIDHAPQLSRSHMELSDSLWAEPDLDDLIANLRKVYLASPEDRQNHRDKAKHTLLTHFTWSGSAQRIRDFVAMLERYPSHFKARYTLATLTLGSADESTALYVDDLLKDLDQDEVLCQPLTLEQLIHNREAHHDAVMIALTSASPADHVYQAMCNYISTQNSPLILCVDEVSTLHALATFEQTSGISLTQAAKRIITPSLPVMNELNKIGLSQSALYIPHTSAKLSPSHQTPSVPAAIKISGLIKAMCSSHW